MEADVLTTEESIDLIGFPPEEQVQRALTHAESVEEVRHTLEDHPEATDRLDEIVQTDREEHVTTPEDVKVNRQRYYAAKRDAERTPSPAERIRGVLPTRLGGTNGDRPTPDPEDVVDGPLKETELPPAVRTDQTAETYRQTGASPHEHLIEAETTADTAVEEATNAGELCWGLRQTPGTHKEFRYAIETSNANDIENETTVTQSESTQVSADKHTDEDTSRGMGL